MKNQKSLLKPSIELLVADIFWGFGFIATAWLLRHLATPAIITYRFLCSFIIGFFILLWLEYRKPFKKRISLKTEFYLSAPSGLLLGLCLYLQTWGLESTSATNSGFITTLYVVFVPFIAHLTMREPLHLLHWCCVAIAIIGTAFIIELDQLRLQIGDLLTLGCSIVASIQIVLIGYLSRKSKSPFALNIFQCFWAGIPFLLFLGKSTSGWSMTAFDWKSVAGILSLIFGSNLLGFFLQLKAQREMPSSLASLFYLLESPFSCFFAVLLLDEKVSWHQGFGAMLIIAACLMALMAERKRRNYSL